MASDVQEVQEEDTIDGDGTDGQAAGAETSIDLIGGGGIDGDGIAADDDDAASIVPVHKRLPHPSGWRRQPGRVRSYHHAMEMMPGLGGRRFSNLRPFYDYAHGQRPLFVRYMRSFAP